MSEPVHRPRASVLPLWGAGDAASMFTGSPVGPTPWGQAARSRRRFSYDTGVVRDLLNLPPVLVEVDPRELLATQPSVTSAGVSHYLTEVYPRTGRTFADYHRIDNRYPVVYDRADGQRLILSGHHRAAAALLRGQPLRARVTAGPWGPARTEGQMTAMPQITTIGDIKHLTPLVSAGELPGWPCVAVSSIEQAVAAVDAGRSCHFADIDPRMSGALLRALGLAEQDATDQLVFAFFGWFQQKQHTGSAHVPLVPEPEPERVVPPPGSSRDLRLRAELKELSVHILCGTIRGPVETRRDPAYRGPSRWQSCRCEDIPVKWQGCDVSQNYDLCILCERGIAGGESKYSWLACDSCRAVNDRLGAMLGRRPLPLGRHSLMNQVAVPLDPGADPQLVARAQDALVGVFAGWRALCDWGDAEFGRMAVRQPWGPDADVPLTSWLKIYPESAQASRDAFCRFTGYDPDHLAVN